LIIFILPEARDEAASDHCFHPCPDEFVNWVLLFQLFQFFQKSGVFGAAVGIKEQEMMKQLPFRMLA
jgi:hypothetical protein